MVIPLVSALSRTGAKMSRAAQPVSPAAEPAAMHHCTGSSRPNATTSPIRATAPSSLAIGRTGRTRH
jgi:hypothetical protein